MSRSDDLKRALEEMQRLIDSSEITEKLQTKEAYEEKLRRVESQKEVLYYVEKEKKKIQSFMLEPTLKSILTEHFKSRGMKWGSGIRHVLMEYMKQEELI